MRILLLNQFFVPDIVATGQLLADVADALVAQAHEVHVICSQGTYAGGKHLVSGEAKKTGERGENGGSVHVYRLKSASRGREHIRDRMRDWASFYVRARAKSRELGKWDACLALSTPPFIGRVGAWLKKRYGARLTIWTMDLWPEVAEELGYIRKDGVISKGLHRVAGRIYASADAIISLGEGMTKRLCARGVDRAKIVEVHNWAPGDEGSGNPQSVRAVEPGGSLQGSAIHNAQLEDTGPFVVMYSGNMGAPHEFDTILDAAEALKTDRSVDFVFVGGGQRKKEISDAAKTRALSNVCFLPPQPLGQLPVSLAAANVHLISMRPEVEGCIVPSKVYGIMAAGRPAIMVGSTENDVATLLAESGAGFSVAQGRSEELADRIRQLKNDPELTMEMGNAGREYYRQHLGRERSVSEIVRVITGK